MASTYVNDLRLNEMATGDASGSWGTVTNTNLELIGEAFSYGTETIGDADSTLTIADGAADAARSFYLKITSSVDLTTTRIVTLGPNTVSKVWMIENATTGSQVITIKQGSGATINVPNGQVKMISTDGAGSGGAVLDLLVDVDLTGTTTLVNLDVSGAVDIAGDLTLSAGGDGALRFTAASSVKVLDNNAAALVFEEADNAYMTFVTTDGSEAVKFDKALDINAATQIDATVTVGVDDTGYDVKFFGATTGKSLLWDESADSLIVTGTTTLVGTTNLDVVDIDGATQIDATVTVGVDDTGYDVKFFGATAGAYMLWDESADDLILGGAAGLSVNSTALVTGVLTTTAATVFNGGFAAGGVGTFADGSNSAPSLTNTGDLNTGLYFPAADEVGLTVGGTQRLNVSATGIAVTGTLTATGDITAGFGSGDVSGALNGVTGALSRASSSSVALLTLTNAHASNNNASLSFTNTDGSFIIGKDRSTGGAGIGGAYEAYMYTNTSRAIVFGVNSAEKMRIDSSGGLITKPAAGGNAVFNEDGVDADFRVESDTNAYMLFVDGNNNRVGVGTVSATSPLHVQGTSNDTIDETMGTAKFGGSGGNGLIVGTIASVPYSTYLQSGYIVDTSLAQYPLSLQPLGGGVIVNESGVDSDFRVESDTNANMLFVDAGKMLWLLVMQQLVMLFILMKTERQTMYLELLMTVIMQTVMA
jgi:hypothetical protein